MAIGPISPTPAQPGAHHHTFSPTQLRVYKHCPERYYRQYIGRERIRTPFNRGTLRGSAVHKVIALHMNARASAEPVAQPLRTIAESYLPRGEYLKAAEIEQWSSDIEQVCSLADLGIRRIPETATVISVEKSFPYVMPTSTRIPGVTLVGKVDVLIRHSEGFLEHIEFKTGWAQPDPFQEVICRIGVCDVYEDRGEPILSTTYQLSTGSEFTLDGDRETLHTTLGEIQETVLEIWSATEWPARECDACVLCNYATSLCSLRGDWNRRTRHETAE